MTCVIAIEHPTCKQVLLASDSFLGDDNIRDVIDRPKFFAVRKGFAIGFAGGVRAAQVLEHCVKFPAKNKRQSDENYLVSVVNTIRRVFIAEGVQMQESSFIFALNGKAYVLQDDFSIVRSNSGFCAIGAGADLALAALTMVEDSPTSDSDELEERARRALNVVVKLHPQVASPLFFMWV